MVDPVKGAVKVADPLGVARLFVHDAVREVGIFWVRFSPGAGGDKLLFTVVCIVTGFEPEGTVVHVKSKEDPGSRLRELVPETDCVCKVPDALKPI